mmetsp:Transcript_42456/g.131489  ORF Transcript_42456/g.131489 Transcript_42456/m.131489 type:complete len:214 (-) Transcript_42456:120-761(-)
MAPPQAPAGEPEELAPGQKPSPRNRRGGSARNNKAGNERERVLNDVVNTGVMAALVGGFALGNMRDDLIDGSALGVWIYSLAVFAVHACTCSALTSAMLYRLANRMDDEAAVAWAADRVWLLRLPLAKFGVGCLGYLLSVLLLAFRALEPHAAACFLSLAAGVMGACTVLTTAGYLAGDPRAWRPGFAEKGPRVFPLVAFSHGAESRVVPFHE